MLKPRVALIVDQPERDLAGLVLTAFDLCQRGATCFLVSSKLQRTELWALAVDFVLLHNLRRRSFEDFVGNLLSANIGVGVLDTEGGAWSSPEQYVELLWDDISMLRKLSCVCNWGPRMSDYLVSKGILLPHQARITGCPRFDFYSPTWRGVYHDADGKNGHNRRILINTNSADANPRFTSVEGATSYFTRFGWSELRIKEWAEKYQRQFDSTIELAHRLAHDYSGEKIVVRPHPFESPDVYLTEFGHYENVEINIGGPVQPQIFKAAAVIQRSCTTAIEAALASVPTFSPQWIPTPFVVDLAEEISTPCNSYAELKSRLDAVLSGEAAGANGPPAVDGNGGRSEIHKWFYLTDGQAHRRVSETILGCLTPNRVVDEEACARHLYGLREGRRFTLGHLFNLIRYDLLLSPDWSFRRMRRIPVQRQVRPGYNFSLSQVEDLVARIGAAMSSHPSDHKPVKVEPSQGFNGFSSNSISMKCVDGEPCMSGI